MCDCEMDAAETLEDAATFCVFSLKETDDFVMGAKWLLLLFSEGALGLMLDESEAAFGLLLPPAENFLGADAGASPKALVFFNAKFNDLSCGLKSGLFGGTAEMLLVVAMPLCAPVLALLVTSDLGMTVD